MEPLVDEPLLDELGVAGPAAEGTGIDGPSIDEPSVDDWFDMAAGVIGGPRPAPAAAGEAVPSPALAAEDAEPEPEPTMRLGTVRRPARDPGPAPDPAPVAAAPVDDAEPDPTMTLGTVRRPATPAPRSAPAPQSTPAPQPAPQPASRFEPQPEPAADLRPAGQPSTPEPGPAVVLRKPAPTGADRAEPSTPSAPADRAPADRAPAGAAAAEPAEDRSRPAPRRVPLAPPVPHVGERPPTYGPEPTALPAADPADLDVIVPDTVLEGAQYGPAILRAASVRGDSARFRGEPRRDALLVTRFGEGEDGLLLAVIASPARSADATAGSAAAAEAAR
ncbi:hypothetical protein ABZ641_38405, partial [Kitasatospora sp. NPDC007106]